MKAKSKKLSYVLRHQFSDEFLPGGWLAVDSALSEVGLTMEELEIIVAENDKGRYELSYDKTLIRALYGHSVQIDLDYIPTTPPDILYHGTASTNYVSILEKGIVSKNRQYVHLSEDIEQSPSTVILEPPKIKSDTVSTVSPSISHEVMGPDAMIFVF